MLQHFFKTKQAINIRWYSNIFEKLNKQSSTILPQDEDGDKALHIALTKPEDYVLKLQRECGGQRLK